jgi:hypothetical protein
VLSGVTPPLALMLADEILVRQRLRARTLGLLAALLAVVQFFIDQEILLTEAGVAILLAVVLAASHRDAIRSHVAFVGRSIAWAVAPAAVLLAYPSWLQFFGAGHLVNAGAIHGTDIYVTDPTNFVVPTVAQLIAPQAAINISSHFSGNASEWDAYLGVPLILLLVLATVRFWRIPAVRTAGVMALIIAVLSLGPHLNVQRQPFLALPLPWWIPAHLPVLDDILPNRLMVYVDLAAAIIVAFALRILWVLRRSALVNVAVAMVVLLPLAPTAPTPTTRLIIPAAFTSAAPAPIAPGDTVLFEPLPGSDYSHAMAWQGSAHFAFRLIGGYIVGPYAPGVEALQELIHADAARGASATASGEDIDDIRNRLSVLGIDDVVVGSDASPGTLSLFASVIETTPTDDDGFVIWRVGVIHG